MASISDIRKDKPKWFVLKKNANLANLCEVCKKHKIIVAVKWGCDFVITTDLVAKDKSHLTTQLHVWCEDNQGLENEKDYTPPQCFREYQDAGFVN